MADNVHVIGLEGALNTVKPFESMRKDVVWIYEQFDNCVRTEGERLIVDLTKATKPAPSRGAISMLKHAAGDKNEFWRVVVHKYLGKDETEGEAEDVRQEKRNLAELVRRFEGIRREHDREYEKVTSK